MNSLNMPRHSLKTQCPSCGIYDYHKVVKSDSTHYRWDNEISDFFIEKTGRDISFREHIRKCSTCSHQFYTVQMAKLYLKTMIDEIKTLQSEQQRILKENQNLTNQVKRLQSKLMMIQRLAAE